MNDEDMVQLVKFWLFKNEDLSSDPQQSHVWCSVPIIPAMRRQRQKDP